ncbi:MAG: bifunctional alpha,alpha-trehalose-phosphate synthase (UDP-forming)/trehalose-phosphatase [Coriobacteriia bacterium]
MSAKKRSPRLLIVSNRLPVTVERRGGELAYHSSVGGLTTGLSSYTENTSRHTRWIGWPAISAQRLDAAERTRMRETLAREHQSEPVFLTERDIADYYYGFSNRTLWPLFHNFTENIEYSAKTWAAYERVNRKFADAVLETAGPHDMIWVQDYQLMLLPALLREQMPQAAIGFFLHIPFPNFETFRMLPWRRQIVEGLLGADLVGFHTYDYARHFLTSARSLVGIAEQRSQLYVDGRRVLVDAFPMGIDFSRYSEAAKSRSALRQMQQFKTRAPAGQKIILSVDRLDYTKGIPGRLRAFDRFLEEHPEWRGRVMMICVAVPSRSQVREYRHLKEDVDRLVGQVNGRWSTMGWTPVRYMYRSLPFDRLTGLYASSDVALVTPLRDGMNLVAKEYCAARNDLTGVLVLSEMAGAAKELGEAILVNPNDADAMVDALLQAIEMPAAEQSRRMEALRHRIKRYDVFRWVGDFLGSLEKVKDAQAKDVAQGLDEKTTRRLLKAYHDAPRRVLLLDYDGTLVPFADRPENVVPDEMALSLVRDLSNEPRNDVVLVSGRDRHTLERSFGRLPISLAAEHGVWIRPEGGEWATIEPMSDSWKPRVRQVLEIFVDRTPGSFIEEKDFSLVWHHRNVQHNLAETRRAELREALAGMLPSMGLDAMEGNRVIEVKRAEINKGRAVHQWITADDGAFILALGDDRTDEDVFDVAPENAWTIKVGLDTTSARFSVPDVWAVRALLCRMTQEDK